MKPITLVTAIAVAAVALVCWRLGFWQLARYRQKHAINVAQRAMLAAPPLELGGRAPELDRARARRVAIRGRFDPRVQVLLRGRAREGEPGVEVVTAFRPADDSLAVLVDRGWLAAEDGATLPASAIPADTARAVTGWLEPFAVARAGAAWRRLETGPEAPWSASDLEPDSVRSRLGSAFAPYVLRALPGPGTPARPRRSEPEPVNESMHLGYAIQWFLFGALAIFGSLQFARSRRTAARRAAGSRLALLAVAGLALAPAAARAEGAATKVTSAWVEAGAATSGDSLGRRVARDPHAGIRPWLVVGEFGGGAAADLVLTVPVGLFAFLSEGLATDEVRPSTGAIVASLGGVAAAAGITIVGSLGHEQASPWATLGGALAGVGAAWLVAESAAPRDDRAVWVALTSLGFAPAGGTLGFQLTRNSYSTWTPVGVLDLEPSVSPGSRAGGPAFRVTAFRVRF